MTDLVGTQVRWRHRDKDTGLPVLPTAGVVVAVGNDHGVFKLLIAQSDGTFAQASATDLIACEIADEHAALDDAIERLRVENTHLATQLESFIDQARKERVDDLEEWIADNIGPVLKAEEPVIEQTIKLLAEFLSELKTTSEERERAATERDELKKANENLAAELAELRRKHKPKGPKGPAE